MAEKSVKNKVLALFVALFILTSCADISTVNESTASGGTTVPTTAEATESAPPPTEPPATEPPVPENSKVSFMAAGDNIIHSPLYVQAAKRAEGTGKAYDFSYAYSFIASLVSSYDLSLINQETLLCGDKFAPSSYPNFSTPTEVGDTIMDIGFDVFSTANNHSLDKGLDGIAASLDYWESRNAVAAGMYRNQADRDNIRVNEVNGVKFSYLSYAESLNGYKMPANTEFQIGDANQIDVMVAEVKKAKQISDVCVVFMHWGVEYSTVISSSQRSVAKVLADAGADIIVGTHPHVLRGIEWVERGDGTRAICAYSLGNFISAQADPYNMVGGILTLDIIKDGATGGISFENIGYIPTVTHYESGFSDVRVYSLPDYTAELAAAHGCRVNGRFDMDYINGLVEDVYKTSDVFDN